ncbi:MAG: glycosyltransferase [Dehalococcoidia bacterium]|nr:glycosyltransferase [Dehalococcoidia bacterium]
MDESCRHSSDVSFSVVIPSFNRAAYLRSTIDSVLAQDYPFVECIVVDAGSTDGTLDILHSYGERITWLSEPDDGPYDAINKGWKRSSGSVLAWLNADDAYEPGALSRAARLFEDNSEVDVIHGGCAKLGSDGDVLAIWGTRQWDYVANLLSCSCTIDQPASFVRREMVERVGGVRRIAVLDFDLWFRISAAGGTFLAVDDVLATACEHPGRITNRPEVMVPAVVQAIDDALRDPRLPHEARRWRRRARSAAYAHGFYFVGQQRWRWVAYCFVSAIRTDPANMRGILARLLNAFEFEPGSPRWAKAIGWSVRNRPHLRGFAPALQLLMAGLLWREFRRRRA